MNGVPMQPWIVEAIRKEMDVWPLQYSHANIESAIDDYRLLLFRNRELEEQLSRLRGAFQKLQGEKRDLLDKVSELHADAHARRELVEIRAVLAESQTHNAKLERDLSDYHQRLGNATEQRDKLQATCSDQKAELDKLRQELAVLEDDRADLQECLEGEKAARVAATEELQERLNSKEQAESRAEKLQAERDDLERKYMVLNGLRVKEQEDVRKEFEQLQEMKRQVQILKDAASGPVATRKPGPTPINDFVRFIRNTADKMSRGGDNRADSTADSTPRVSDAAPLQPEPSIAALYPDTVLRHHEKAHRDAGGCTAVAFSGSGMQAATCGADGVVRLWTTHDGNLATELTGASKLRHAVNDVCFTLTGEAVLAASADNSVRLWDVNSGKVKHTLTGHTGSVVTVAQHPFSYKSAASCGEDRCIKIWTLDTGFCQRSILCSSKPYGLTYTADGLLLVSAHYDGAVRVWDASSGSLLQEIKEVHAQPMTAVVATPASHRVVGCGRDNVVSVVDVSRFQVIKRFRDPVNIQVGQSKCTPCVSPDGKVFALGSNTGAVLLVDMKDGSVASKLVAHTTAVTCVAWNARNEDYAVCAASVDRAGDVVFWKSNEGHVAPW